MTTPAQPPQHPCHIEHYLSPIEDEIVAIDDFTPTLHFQDTQAEIHRVVVGPLDNNVFVLRCRQTGDAVLVDAADEHQRLLELCQKLNVKEVIETHGHWDHIQAVPALRDAGYEVQIGKDDSQMLPSYDKIIDPEAPIKVGKLSLQPIHTPGHTPGSICFKLEGSSILFSGDTLFPGGPGNTSFEGGDFETIIKSIDELLFKTLAPETIVMPGHGRDSTIGKTSPNIEIWAERGW